MEHINFTNAHIHTNSFFLSLSLSLSLSLKNTLIQMDQIDAFDAVVVFHGDYFLRSFFQCRYKGATRTSELTNSQQTLINRLIGSVTFL